MTESTGELGEGFSVGIAKAWEREFFDRELPETRRVALRTAIVLGGGSVLSPLVLLSRLGLGGAHLDGPWPATRARLAAGTHHAFRARGGSQRFSWVHLEDVLGVIEFLEIAPTSTACSTCHRPTRAPTGSSWRPCGACSGCRSASRSRGGCSNSARSAIRTETELVLKSRWVVPERLLDAGYRFRFPLLEPALRDDPGRACPCGSLRLPLLQPDGKLERRIRDFISACSGGSHTRITTAQSRQGPNTVHIGATTT